MNRGADEAVGRCYEVRCITECGISQSPSTAGQASALTEESMQWGCYAIAGQPAPTLLANLHPQLCEE